MRLLACMMAALGLHYCALVLIGLTFGYLELTRTIIDAVTVLPQALVLSAVARAFLIRWPAILLPGILLGGVFGGAGFAMIVNGAQSIGLTMTIGEHNIFDGGDVTGVGIAFYCAQAAAASLSTIAAVLLSPGHRATELG